MYETTITMYEVSGYKFTAKERDTETGNDYFGARFYENNLGRFASVDPKIIAGNRVPDRQRWNVYSYVRNNPLGYVDPDGMELKPPDVQMAAALTRAMKSETVRTALAPYMRKDHDRVIQRGELGFDPKEPGRKVLGETKPTIVPLIHNYTSATSFTDVPAHLGKTTTITVDDSVKEGKGHDQLDGVLKHEISRANDAARDPQTYLDQEEANEDKLHDEKTQEERADSFSQDTQKEVDQYEHHESGDQKREDQRKEKP